MLFTGYVFELRFRFSFLKKYTHQTIRVVHFFTPTNSFMLEVISPPIITARVRAHSQSKAVCAPVTHRHRICDNCCHVMIHEIVVGGNVVFIVDTKAGEASNDSSYKNPAKRRYQVVTNAILNNLI